ncbi:MAG: SGNH/GDSL hydrolase family protein [Planctomycetes bacterium]|nr:SGNH/GDSL hydrolase family protein [Planctomycetota bacterium]
MEPPARSAPPLEGYDLARLEETLGRHARLVLDPVAGELNEPSWRSKFPWTEHPSGSILRRINAQGFNEDEPTEAVATRLRILVGGDSHTAGVVWNPESFTNVAEASLNALALPCELINAGVGCTGPRLYLGSLRKHLALAPRVYVAVLFAGNDFMDDLVFERGMDARPLPPRPEGYHERLERATERFAGPVTQGINQAYLFHYCPELTEEARAAVTESILGMRELCERNGIAFLLVLLPTKMDVDEDDRDSWRACCTELGLAPADLELNLALGRRVLADASAAGVECLDPTDRMRAEPAPLYWVKDYHLGLAGHALLGELLAQRLQELVEHLPPR